MLCSPLLLRVREKGDLSKFRSRARAKQDPPLAVPELQTKEAAQGTCIQSSLEVQLGSLKSALEQPNSERTIQGSVALRQNASTTMEVAVSAAWWVVTKALAPVTDGLLEAWAASAGLGPNIDALKMQLLYAQGMLNNAPGQGRDITNPALKGLLHKLRQLAYVADDALDELDYFRIQDALDGTYHAAADVDDRGCLQALALNARHTARAVAGKIKSMSSCSRAASPPDDQEDIGGSRGCPCVGGCSMPKVAPGAVQAAVGKHFPCCYSSPHTSELAESPNMPAASGRRLLCGACPPKVPAQRVRTIEETPKLKFDRVEMSKRMIEIVEQLKHVCAMVSTILNLELLSLSRIPTQVDLAMDRQKTTPHIIEPQLYGRDTQKKEIIDGITHGEYSSKQLTVLPIVGPGGVGKTTFTQHIFEEVKSCFQVTIWICVSLNFTADRLAQEILEQIPKDNSESKNSSKEELIEQRLRSKRFLLVLDDVWKYHDDEWKKLLAPFKKVGTEGNMVIVTTRIPGVANMVRTVDHSIEMERLGPQDIMSFFEACVFGDKQQPWQDHPELLDVGQKIVENLKGFPLAAKTVGRLLRNQLTFDHWTRVLESKEWESQASDNDIMPALKLSYDYLPFHLQQCLSYCALFPEDYEFRAEELVHLWIGLGILHSDGQKKRIEDAGLCYLADLVNQGFFKENVPRFGSPYYTIHDLLLELVVKVSSYECLSISSSNVMSIQIPPSVRHLSIIVDDADVKDRVTFEEYKRGLQALEKRFEVQNLHTVMLFGEYHGNFSRVFRGLFLEARALRTVFLSGASYNVEDVLPNFSKLVHLRYLRIKSAGFYDKGLCISSVLCRFYHLEVIDLQGWKGRFGSTRYMSNLVKLRHFVVPREELHSEVFEVGRLKFINELRAFRVGQEGNVSELSQLGKLVNIGGLLGIYNLEKVRSEEEATESKLIQKSHMKELILEWDVQRSNRNPKFEENILENLVPHNNIRRLSIRGHGGTACPRWLGSNLSVKNLESLSLDDLSWGNLPPIGEMWMVNDVGVEYQDCILGQRFQNLKRLGLVNIPKLRKWVVDDNTSHLFSQLEELAIEGCSELTELRFSRRSSGLPQQEKSMAWFPRLKSLSIEDCPKLLSFPPIPWTSRPCSAVITRVGSGLQWLAYQRENGSDSGCSLQVEGKDGQDSVFLNGLVFSNLTYLKTLVMENCCPLPLDCLQMLTSLDFLQISDSSNVLSPTESVSHVQCLLPVKKVHVWRCGCTGKELTELFSLMPELTEMAIEGCQEIKWLGVEGQSSASSSSAAEQLHHGQIGQQQQQQESKGGVDGVLLLPPQLQKLTIEEFPELSLLSYSLEDEKEGGELQGLCSLQYLEIRKCPKLLHSYSSSSFPFPTTLQELYLDGCGEFRGEGIGPLLAQGHLTKLWIWETPKFFAGSEPLDKELLPRSSAHQELELRTDDIAGLLAAHSCSLLSSSLTTLTVGWNKDAEGFTHEQAEALALLTSLQTLEFSCCEKLQCLPAGLHRLASLETLLIVSCQVIRSLPEDGLPSSLKKLEINNCPAIKSLPKGSLPSSLQVLNIYSCHALMSLPKNGLPSSLQKFAIWNCPALKSLPEDGLRRSLQELKIAGSTAITSLPKGGLPRSLQVLDVSYCDNEELKRHCRKLRGTIPKIIA